MAWLKGASVAWQDYNAEVIRHWTIPNVRFNLDAVDDEEHEQAMQRASFYAGDWGALAPLLRPSDDPSGGLDMVLMAETVYAVESYPALIGLLRDVLRGPGAEVYSASKTYYFGVGECCGGRAAMCSHA